VKQAFTNWNLSV